MFKEWCYSYVVLVWGVRTHWVWSWVVLSSGQGVVGGGDWGRPPAYKLLRVCTGSHADIYLSQHTDGELGKAFYFDYCYGVWSVACLCLRPTSFDQILPCIFKNFAQFLRGFFWLRNVKRAAVPLIPDWPPNFALCPQIYSTSTTLPCFMLTHVMNLEASQSSSSSNSANS